VPIQGAQQDKTVQAVAEQHEHSSQERGRHDNGEVPRRCCRKGPRDSEKHQRPRQNDRRLQRA
jgi:hypothetical protein